MSKPKLSLDHDSTLAATSAVAFDLILGDEKHDFSYDNIESWEWGLETFGPARFLSGMWHAWTLRPLEVPPMEPKLAETVADLREHYEVHIVSSYPDHMGITEGKQQWLDHHGIEYDDFVPVHDGTSKAELEYDVYVDDKPTLPERVNELRPHAEVFLYDHLYNQDAEGDYIRVNSLRHAADILLTQEVEA